MAPALREKNKSGSSINPQQKKRKTTSKKDGNRPEQSAGSENRALIPDPVVDLDASIADVNTSNSSISHPVDQNLLPDQKRDASDQSEGGSEIGDAESENRKNTLDETVGMPSIYGYQLAGPLSLLFNSSNIFEFTTVQPPYPTLDPVIPTETVNDVFNSGQNIESIINSNMQKEIRDLLGRRITSTTTNSHIYKSIKKVVMQGEGNTNESSMWALAIQPVPQPPRPVALSIPAIPQPGNQQDA
ncbi:hypothetical protein CSUB01_02294 [Colletotrichum sublineola]|uniref:Uncharacterized protein n=1 Tax=Colletotrichum sublineola TaxID=1173701 RepID=A0A066XC71_COLSU|nr:hypothetical protein CSUB01_02294 [Colletotrichum sublineola]